MKRALTRLLFVAAAAMGTSTMAQAHQGDPDVCMNGSGDDAIKNCSELIKAIDSLILSRQAPPTAPATVATVYYARGRAYEGKGELDLAASDFAEAASLNPKYEEAYAELCWDLGMAGKNLDAGLSACNAALQIKPDDVLAMDSRGFVELRLGKYTDAITDYDTSIVNNRRASSLFGRGIAKLRSGDASGGKSDIDAATALDPGIVQKYAGYGVTP